MRLKKPLVIVVVLGFVYVFGYVLVVLKGFVGKVREVAVQSGNCGLELLGDVNVSMTNATWPEINFRLSKDVEKGGLYSNTDCSNDKTAIIISFRNREAHLLQFLNHMIPILKRQKRTFKIFLIEPQPDEKFGKGTLYNIGYKLALKTDTFNCFIFHDVDLLLENDNLLYNCHSRNPKHLSVAVDKFSYRLPYSQLVGGVIAVPAKTFRLLNGFSNKFWNWGGEDDNFYYRICSKIFGNFRILRPSEGLGRYKSLEHEESSRDRSSYVNALLKYSKGLVATDGLSDLKFELKKTVLNPLYTHLFVEIYEKDYVDTGMMEELEEKWLVEGDDAEGGNRLIILDIILGMALFALIALVLLVYYCLCYNCF